MAENTTHKVNPVRWNNENNGCATATTKLNLYKQSSSHIDCTRGEFTSKVKDYKYSQKYPSGSILYVYFLIEPTILPWATMFRLMMPKCRLQRSPETQTDVSVASISPHAVS